MTAVSPAVLSTPGRLAAVGLDELTARAGLLTRIDRKYVLPLPAADEVLDRLAAVQDVRVLQMAGEREFGYESLYLDTPDLAGYHLSARGRRRRFKVRRRTYLDSGDVFVEVKTRGTRGATVKQRIPWTGSAREAAAFVEETLRGAGIHGVAGAELRPVLRTAYRRTTLLLTATDDRVTVDTALTWSLPGGKDVRVDGLAIVETKSAAGTTPADRVLWRTGSRPCRMSKYGTGLAALRGDLPDNRWWPVLRRRFPHLLPTNGSTS